MASHSGPDQGETRIALIIERALERDEGRRLGLRAFHNHSDGIGHAVDFIYASAHPPVALEVTTVRDDRFIETAANSPELEEHLSAIARSETLGDWWITITAKARIKALKDQLPPLLRMRRTVRVGDYSRSELRLAKVTGEPNDVLAMHKKLRDLEVVALEQSPTQNLLGLITRSYGVRICVIDDRGISPWSGLAEVTELVASNAAKLASTGYEGHLAIGVHKFAFSSDPAATPVPPMPKGVDRVWLVRLWTTQGGASEVWSATTAANTWTVHEPVQPTVESVHVGGTCPSSIQPRDGEQEHPAGD